MTDPFDRLIDEGMANGEREPEDVLLEMIAKLGRSGVTKKEFHQHPFTKLTRPVRNNALNKLMDEGKVKGFERHPNSLRSKKGGRPRGSCFIHNDFCF